MTWHYILAKTNPRLLQYQRLTDHPDAATVEDQLDFLVPFLALRALLGTFGILPMRSKLFDLNEYFLGRFSEVPKQGGTEPAYVLTCIREE
jgi:hypothetical protein